MPGWGHRSWGYHGDDGQLFCIDVGSNRGRPYGPTFGSGDVIGCGVDFGSKSAFFTKNGEHLGEAGL